MLYFNWSLSCLPLTTAGHPCCRTPNREKLWAIRGGGHFYTQSNPTQIFPHQGASALCYMLVSSDLGNCSSIVDPKPILGCCERGGQGTWRRIQGDHESVRRNRAASGGSSAGSAERTHGHGGRGDGGSGGGVKLGPPLRWTHLVPLTSGSYFPLDSILDHW